VNVFGLTKGFLKITASTLKPLQVNGMKCKVCGQPPKINSKDAQKFSRKTGFCSIECQEKFLRAKKEKPE
jgi:hypothetical protein